jgi:hypothetical protein
MKRPSLSALFLLPFLLASLSLGIPQQPNSSQTKPPDLPQAILAAKTVAVIGVDGYGKKCPQPPFPCAKRPREQTQNSLRKWGRFTLVEDPSKADLVVVAMESQYVTRTEDETWAQLRVFKGPVTPTFLAQVQEELGAQLRVYTGPVAWEKQPQPLWEGWRCSERPGVRNPTAAPLPGFLQSLLLGTLETLEQKRRDKELERRAKENPYDRQVVGEVVGGWGDAVGGIMDLFGKTARDLDRMVAEDFSRDVAEAEKPATPSFTVWTGPPGEARRPESAPALGQGVTTQEAPSPPSATEQPKQEQPQQPSATVLRQPSHAMQVKIPDGTAVHVVMKNSVSSESATKDDLLELVVAEPVVVDGVTVITAGATARGMVVQAKKSTEKKDGSLAWGTKDVSAADGTLVPLRLLKMPGPGGKKLTAGDVGTAALLGAAATLLAPQAWAYVLLDALFPTGARPPRGRAVEVPAGEHFLAFVNGDVAVATKGAALPEPGGGKASVSPAVAGTKETAMPQERWSFVQFDRPFSLSAEFTSEFRATIGKAAAEGHRLAAVCDKGVLLDKAASPPDLYRYLILPISERDFDKFQPALNQRGAWGYRWWHNALGDARLDEFLCLMEKAPGRPNQFQYVYPPEPGTFGTTTSAKQGARVQQRVAEVYREGYREAYHVPSRGAVMERAAEVPPAALTEGALDPAEPYLWLPELLPPRLTPEARASLEELRGRDFETSARKLVAEIQAAAARGYRVVSCSLVVFDYDCLLAKRANPTGGMYEYKFLSVVPEGLKTASTILDEAGAKGYRLHGVLTTGDRPADKNIEILLEKDPQGRQRYVYEVFTEKTVEGLLSAMNAATGWGYLLKKFYWSKQLEEAGYPGWVAIMEKPLQ